jgi:hypothetical protein
MTGSSTVIEARQPTASGSETRVTSRGPPDARLGSHSQTTVASTSTTSYAHACVGCNDSGRNISYCNVCEHMLCDGCWDAQLVHQNKKKRPGETSHEKTTPSVAEKVRNALAPPKDEFARERLCREDEITTWFGIAIVSFYFNLVNWSRH